MNHKKLEKLNGAEESPNGLQRLMVEEQMKTNTKLAYMMGLLGAGGVLVIPLLFLILDKVTGG